MDTNWLDDLQALAQTLNFSRAAELRNITQPAFGRRIRSLESWCGSELVNRGTHRLSLTPAGEVMLGAATDVTRRLERARHELEQMQAATATLTFASTHALSFIFFPGWVHGLGPAASAMPIRLLSDNMNECEKIMLSGGAQFLLCHHHAGSRNNLPAADFQHIVLGLDRLIPVSGRDNAGQPLYRLPGTDAAPVPSIAFEPTSGLGRILSSALLARAHHLHLNAVFTSHLALVLKTLAADGKGVAWIPESLARDEFGPQGRLAVAGSGEWTVEVQIALFRRRTRLPDMAEQFWNLAQRRQGSTADAARAPFPAAGRAGNR